MTPTPAAGTPRDGLWATLMALGIGGLILVLLMFTPRPWQVLPILASVLAFALLAGMTWALVRAKSRCQILAQNMTRTLREALGRYLSHIENTPMGVIEWDQDFRIRAWNPAAERIFGYSPTEVLGRLGDGFLTPEGEGASDPGITFRRLLPGGGGTRLTHENLRKDGTPIICNWYNAPLRDSAGRTIGVTTLVEDITERKRAEEALRMSQKLESLGVLAGGIAHDFNNLLTAIQGHTELALARVEPANPLFDNLKRIEATTHRAADLSRQMLAYSGRAKFATKPMDLNQLVRDMVDLLKVSIPKKVQLTLALEKHLPAIIGDQAQIQQVALNLVSNAAEAIGDGAGKVSIHTTQVNLDSEAVSTLTFKDDMAPGAFICLEVRDTGSGMPPGIIEKIFDPFFTTKFTGRGLGLSATVGILRSHGGGLRVTSEEGVGTTFQVYLPVTELAAPATQGPSQPQGSAETGTVLVVDDEGIVRDLAVMALQPLGYEVLTAQDGQEALEIYEANQGRIKVVLMDMTMPRMDGLEAFQRIRALDPQARVILSSGYSEQEAIHSARDLNPEGFLQKPYRIQDLLQRVHEAIHRE